MKTCFNSWRLLVRTIYLLVTFLIFLFLGTASCTDKTKEPNADHSTPSVIADGMELPKFKIILRISANTENYFKFQGNSIPSAMTLGVEWSAFGSFGFISATCSTQEKKNKKSDQ